MRRWILSLMMWTVSCLMAWAQNAIVEESLTEVNCESLTHATVHYKTVITILNEQGAAHAGFVCSCSKQEKLVSFRGQITNASGQVVRKLKESELKRTEYSQYLAVDAFTMYLEYTPPFYPVTVTYEWTIDNKDNLAEFPWFCPQPGYDVAVKKASYQLTAPKDMAISYAKVNVDQDVVKTEGAKNSQVYSLQLTDLPAVRQEPYARPLRERLPIVYFAPRIFAYYGSQGSLESWNDYGKWEYGLLKGRDALPEKLVAELHQMTDHLQTDREKVEKVYEYLGSNTRYVAVLLGLGGQQPAPASYVSKSGFGDCKGLSNYMRAMLQAIGIPSYYTTISTDNRRLLKDFASVGQMNHVILEVPLPDDTLWLECTNPQLPIGYVHQDIAGHDAIEVSADGGRMVHLPVYADSTNLMHSTIRIALDAKGSAQLSLDQEFRNCQYENRIPLLKMNDKDRQKVLLRMMPLPQAEFSRLDIREEGAMIKLEAEVTSQRYANVTGQRVFVPLCPVHRGYSIPSAGKERQEDIYLNMGYVDEDDIQLTFPEGYEIEAKPQNMVIEEPFGSFVMLLLPTEDGIRIVNRLLMKSGVYDKSQYPKLVEFVRSVSSAYAQKVVLKKKE